jgi:DNA-binding transcriptional ArsR family regulator
LEIYIHKDRLGLILFSRPHKKFSSKSLRNQLVAYIFATVRFHKKNELTMRRDIFQAIADPTRRAIMLLIAANSMTPNAIAEHFDTSRQAVSKHLRILIECELVTQKHDGREIHYQLQIDKMKEIDKWLEQFRGIWENRFSQLDTVLKKLKTRKS